MYIKFPSVLSSVYPNFKLNENTNERFFINFRELRKGTRVLDFSMKNSFVVL